MVNPPSLDSEDSTQLMLHLRKRWSLVRSHFLTLWISLASLIFFLAATLRHTLFQSTAFDLGIYDQIVYLMSRGLPQISSYLGFHHMGNHAAFSLYPLALLYWIYPSVYWLFAVQAVFLALGALPTWMLARQAGLSRSLSQAMVAAYLFYPLVFNLNLFDFHPEVMALAAFLLAIWTARSQQNIGFCVVILFVLGCKDALSMTIAAMGFWLLVFEKRRFCGLFALLVGSAWFFLTTQWMIPMLSGTEAAAVDRYSELGDSVLEIGQNLLLKPSLVLNQIFSPDTSKYLSRLLAPLVWGLVPQHLAPLVSGIPALLANLLSESPAQRDVVHQYSLPILPFLLVAAIDALAAGRGWLRQRRWIVLWSIVFFVLLGKYTRFYPEYVRSLDTWAASREAIAQIEPHQGGVITDNFLGAHLSQRPFIQLLRPAKFEADVQQADYVLLNLNNPWQDNVKPVKQVLAKVEQNPAFQLGYQRDGVYLFQRK